MGIGAIVLGVFAFICMLAGAILSWVPFLGTMLSFLAPVLAMAGIILGGVALSRAKNGGGESEGLAMGGLVTSILAFVPAVLVALSCGVCNICATAMYLDPELGAYDAGPPDSAVPPNAYPYPMPVIPSPPPSTMPTPSPAMPPPPLPPGPGAPGPGAP